MRKLDFVEFKLCQFQGRLFEDSIESAHFSSPMFIRRYMTSDLTRMFVNKSFITISYPLENVIEELNIIYKPSTKKPMYSKDQMYWIGYMYLAICYLYEINAKKVYKLFPPKEIVKYYFIYHTFDIEEAAERMMENINYDDDYISQGVKFFKEKYLETGIL